MMMKRTVVLAMFLLTACGDNVSTQIENAVKNKLTDPESVIYGETLISDDRRRACIEYNSKNTFGGYAGQSIAVLKSPYEDYWVVLDLKGESWNCTSTGFKAADTRAALRSKALTQYPEIKRVVKEGLPDYANPAFNFFTSSDLSFSDDGKWACIKYAAPNTIGSGTTYRVRAGTIYKIAVLTIGNDGNWYVVNYDQSSPYCKNEGLVLWKY